MAIRPVKTIDDATASNSNVDGGTAVVLGGAAAWIVYGIGQPLVFDVSDREFNPLIVAAGLFAIGAAFFLVRAVRRRGVVSRFGTTVFEQDGFETYVGETLRGRVVTSRPLAAPDGFQLRVRCIERKGESFDETRRRTGDAIVWETTRTVHTADSRGGIGVEVPIPATALAEARLGSGDWTLKVEATVDGTPFQATFPLRVYGGTRDADETGDPPDEAESDDASSPAR